MSRLNNLLQAVAQKDRQLAADLRREVEVLRRRRPFRMDRANRLENDQTCYSTGTSAPESILIVPRQVTGIRLFTGIGRQDTQRFAVMPVIVSAIFELFPNATTDFNMVLGSDGNVAGVEQPV